MYATGTGKVDAACPEGGVAAGEVQPVGGFQPVAGSVCGLFQTTVQAPNFSTNSGVITNTALTIAVKWQVPVWHSEGGVANAPRSLARAHTAEHSSKIAVSR